MRTVPARGVAVSASPLSVARRKRKASTAASTNVRRPAVAHRVRQRFLNRSVQDVSRPDITSDTVSDRAVKPAPHQDRRLHEVGDQADRQVQRKATRCSVTAQCMAYFFQGVAQINFYRSRRAVASFESPCMVSLTTCTCNNVPTSACRGVMGSSARRCLSSARPVSRCLGIRTTAPGPSRAVRPLTDVAWPLPAAREKRP